MSTPPSGPYAQPPYAQPQFGQQPQYGYPPPQPQPQPVEWQYGGQPGQPYAPPPAAPRRSRWNFGWLGWTCVALSVLIVGWFLFSSLTSDTGSPRNARRGDCVYVLSPAPGSSVEKIKCSNPKANYTVVYRYDYDGLLADHDCTKVGGTTGYHGRYTTKRGNHRYTHTYLLCLAPKR